MSDISLRLDGLLLGLVILAGGALFLAIAIVSTLAALLAGRPERRSWRIPRRGLYLVLAHVAALAVLAVLADRVGASTGPDWIDWLAIPWIVFVLVGLAALVRVSRS